MNLRTYVRAKSTRDMLVISEPKPTSEKRKKIRDVEKKGARTFQIGESIGKTHPLNGMLLII